MTLSGQELGRIVDYIRKNGTTLANPDVTNVRIVAEVIGTPVWLHYALATDPCVYEIGGQGWTLTFFAWRLHTINDVMKAEREGHARVSMFGAEWKLEHLIPGGEPECMSRDFMILRMADCA